MCGITGYFAFGNHPAANAENNLANAARSADCLIARGPDAGNIFSSPRTALGHRRLSIIDTSHAADQPMQDRSGRYVIVFNGEIFNFRELSEARLGEVWRENGGPLTGSDTEVLLYLLIRYGVECLDWLSGFFAFALYDREKDELLLARDAFGKKPLLYYQDGSYLAFASEMKALLQWGIPRELDAATLYQYLQLNYVPQPTSMIRGVRKLPQGHYLKAGPEGVREEGAYYRLETHPERYGEYSYEAAQQRLITLMDESVKRRLIADVPLGAFLSGGVDSSVIVALASRHTSHLNTFSIGYKDNPFFDETAYARLVADQYKTEHTVFSLTNDDFVAHVLDVLNYLDEPFADSSAIPVFILCRHTRRHVTVALSGDGGDEVFSGYNKHAAEWKMRRKSTVNQLVRLGAPLWRGLPHSRSNKFTNIFRQLHRFAEGAKLSPADRYWRWASILPADEANRLIKAGVLSDSDRTQAGKRRNDYIGFIDGHDFNEVLLADMNLVLLSDMLVKVDMMSMANSLEVRSPFLDKEVVDFAFGLPTSYKVNGLMKKRILQDAFRHMLPDQIYNRPKHGFEIPMLGWLRKELWSMINDDLLKKSFVEEQGIFDPVATEDLKKQLQSSNPGDSHATIWALIVFQHWWKKYFYYH